MTSTMPAIRSNQWQPLSVAAHGGHGSAAGLRQADDLVQDHRRHAKHHDRGPRVRVGESPAVPQYGMVQAYNATHGLVALRDPLAGAWSKNSTRPPRSGSGLVSGPEKDHREAARRISDA